MVDDVIRDNLIAFRITRKIAEGGMGAVYEAVQNGSHAFRKRVALKLLLPQLCTNPKYVGMFTHEARLVANLVHEHIVQIYHLGQHDDGYFIVMEYVHGLSLNDLMRIHLLRETRLPESLSVFICSRLARGLSYAHAYRNDYGEPMNIVHRDVCPANIMINTNGLVKLTDFGIATATTEWHLEHPDAVVGRFEYMSPEQALRSEVDHRADVYAIGAVLFELLSGVRIREADSQETLLESAKAGLVNWAALPETVPDELRSLLERLLAYAPEDRIVSTAEVARAMEVFLYRDGYGPTSLLLQEHLEEAAPHLYEYRQERPRRLSRPKSVRTRTDEAVPADLTAAPPETCRQ